MCANSPKSHPPLSSGSTLLSTVSPLSMKPLPTSCPPHIRRWKPQPTLPRLHTLKAPVVTCPGCIPGLGTLFGHSLGFLPLVFKDHHSVWGFWKDMMIALLTGDICFQAKCQRLFREIMF